MLMTLDQVIEKVILFGSIYLIALDQGFGSTMATFSGLFAALFGKKLFFLAVRLWISWTY